MASIEDIRGPARAKFQPRSKEGETSIKILLGAVALLLLCRAVLAATAELAEDEAYYWVWSTHLAASYYDHPPMIAYWIRGGTALFGHTAFGIRFVALVSVLAGSFLLYRASLSLFQERKSAVLTVIWLNATILCNAAAILATPDTPLAFFATLALFALAKLIETERGAWWYAVGAALGLAFVSKYTAALLLPGLFLWMAASSNGRRWFARPEPYLAAILALLIITPVVYWNYSHDWASFAKQLHHGVKDKPASAFKSVGEFVAGQAGLATPLIFLFCVFGCGLALLRGLRRGDSRWLLLGAMSAPVFAFFLIHAASQKIQPNWPGFLYGAAILAAVHSFIELSRERRIPSWIAAGFNAAPFVGIVFTLTAFLQLGLSPLPLPAKQDPTSRLKGWAKLAHDIDKIRAGNGADAILTDRYALTGELAFYTQRPEDVFQINERIRYANLPEPDENKLKDRPAILVVHKGGDVERISPFFSNARFVITLKREAGVESRDAYDVYALSGYRGGLFNSHLN